VYWVTGHWNVTEERACNISRIRVSSWMATRGMLTQIFFQVNVTDTEYTIISEDKIIPCTTAIPHRYEELSPRLLLQKMDRTKSKCGVSYPDHLTSSHQTSTCGVFERTLCRSQGQEHCKTWCALNPPATIQEVCSSLQRCHPRRWFILNICDFKVPTKQRINNCPLSCTRN
jgi:hypothetical protein